MKYAILLFPLLFFSLYGMGEWLRFRILGESEFSAGRIARALGLGILAHGLLMTLLGFVHLLTPTIAAVVTALPALIFWKVWLRDVITFFKKATWKPSVRFTLIEVVFIVVIIGINLLRAFNALAPNISWDATSHHYLVPSVWLSTGRLSDLPSVIFSYYPSLAEMGMTGSMALGTDFLANLYGWIFGPLAALILIGIGARHGGELISKADKPGFNAGRFAGIVAAFLFTLFPGVGVQTSGGYVDLPLACWVLLTIDFLFEYKSCPTWRNIMLAGLFTGAALATKHLALIIFPGFVVYLIWVIFNAKVDATNRPNWKHLFAFIGISLLIVLPWYIRSAWFTGNPFYPFGVFGLPTPAQPPFTSASWVRPDYERSLTGFITYWLYLTFTPTVGHALGRNYSMAFPVLLPLLALVPKLKPTGRFLSILSVISIVILYGLIAVETRYHLPFVATAALVLGILITQWITFGFERIGGIALLIGSAVVAYYISVIHHEYTNVVLWTINIIAVISICMIFVRSQRARIILITILLFVIGAGSLTLDIQPDYDEFGYRREVVLNLESEDSYMLRSSPFNYGVITHINNLMDWENMRVLALEPRLYRLKADWVTWFGLKEDTVPTTPAENVAIWYRGGFTHILLGDDVMVKALLYYNVVHAHGWDVPGATPEERIEYLREHPEENRVNFLLQELWYSFDGEPFGHRARHFTHYWLPREIEKEVYPIENVDGINYYVANRLDILADPEKYAQYAFVRDFREMVETGGLEIVFSDQMTYLFRCDYPAYLESHPDVDLETLGLD